MLRREVSKTRPRRFWFCVLAGQCLMACSIPQAQQRSMFPVSTAVLTHKGAPGDASAATGRKQAVPEETEPAGAQSPRTLYSRSGPAPRAETGAETWIVLTVFLVSMSALTGFVLLRTLPPFCDASLGCHQAP